MFDDALFDLVPKYDDFTYWFVPNGTKHVDVFPKVEEAYKNSKLVTVAIEDHKLVFTDKHVTELGAEVMCSILADWNFYIQRPEYHMISAEICNDDTSEYETQLVGSIFIKEYKAGHNPDNAWTGVKRCLDWLRSTDFYTCPASTQYHDSHPAGLLKHSLNVSDRALELCECSVFSPYVAVENAVFAALVHDWCKIGLYTPYMRNVKDEATNQWVQQLSYKYADERTICLGHGVSSMYLAMRFFNIPMEVALAIRWHMGHWNCVDSEANEMQQAARNYPLVHLLQFADQLAIVNY